MIVVGLSHTRIGMQNSHALKHHFSKEVLHVDRIGTIFYSLNEDVKVEVKLLF